MPKLLTIQIPQPCGEDPSKMLSTEKGSYCLSCKKEVIDFRGMSDSGLAVFFKKNHGEVCGRFYSDQLNKQILLPKRDLPWLKYLFTITLPAFLLSLKSTAQHKTIPASHILSLHKLNDGRGVLIPEYLDLFTGKVMNQKANRLKAYPFRS